MSEAAKDIYQALNRVMGEVGYVLKTKAKGLNYTFASEAALIEAIRPHFVAHGIVVHPSEIQSVHQDSYTTASGKVMNRTTIVTAYRFTHAESGTFIDVPAVGEGADMGDKSAPKAMTLAYKYALRQALMIETGDDPDRDPSEPQAQPISPELQKWAEEAYQLEKVKAHFESAGRIVDFAQAINGNFSLAIQHRYDQALGAFIEAVAGGERQSEAFQKAKAAYN